MKVSELQDEIRAMEKKIIEKGGKFEHPQLLRILKANEEIGELSSILLRLLVKTRKGEKLDLDKIKEELSLEIVDTITPLIGIANYFEIDLESAFQRKFNINKKRYE